MNLYKKVALIVFVFISAINIHAQQSNVIIEGVLVDNYQMPIPYVSVYIPTKYVGTTSTDEGEYYLALEKSNLQDTLVVTSMGFKTYKIKVDDYIKQNLKTIVLEEDVTALDAVEIIVPQERIPQVLKLAKKTFITDSHQLNLVYRRTNVEHDVSKFFVEQYMSIIYKGPKSEIIAMQVKESRKSADYRIAKATNWNHAAVYMTDLHPLKDFYTPLKKMDWKKIGDTTYDGEDVLIMEGTEDNVDGVDGVVTIVIYIGFETNNIYKVESSVGKCVYQYVKNAEGKLYLSYHKREYNGRSKIDPFKQKLLKLKTPYISHAFRHEAIVLGIETDKKKFDTEGYEEFDKEMGDIKLPYHPVFWKNLSLPPETAFYKKIKAELESNYGVPLETQFKIVN